MTAVNGAVSPFWPAGACRFWASRPPSCCSALRDSIVVLHGPQDALAELDSGQLVTGERLRVGRLVMPGSVEAGGAGSILSR